MVDNRKEIRRQRYVSALSGIASVLALLFLMWTPFAFFFVAYRWLMGYPIVPQSWRDDALKSSPSQGRHIDFNVGLIGAVSGICSIVLGILLVSSFF